jgi:hypothetical protein
MLALGRLHRYVICKMETFITTILRTSNPTKPYLVPPYEYVNTLIEVEGFNVEPIFM